MSKPWGKIGNWAAEAEAEEQEQREQAAAAAVAAPPPQSFPSLKEAAAAKPKKKKATMTLSQFTTGTYVGPGGGARRDSAFEPKGLTPDEMLRLPTGPKERSAEEMEHGRLGGGFKSYGGRTPGGRMSRGDDGEGGGSWGGGGGGGGGGGRRSYGGFDDERRTPNPRSSDFDLPSRADEADNWGSKKVLPFVDSRGGGGGGGRSDRYSQLGGGGGGFSRADEVDNWAVGKKPLPSRTTSFGSGFRDQSAPESDRWGRSGGGPPPLPSPREGGDHGRERPRLVLDPPRGDGSVNEGGKSNRPSPFGAARPREEVLAEKGLDWRKVESEIVTRKTSRPTSAHSSRPSSAHSSRPQSPATQVVEGAIKPRPKVNPFGEAKPREVVLKEHGKDWRKIDFELECRAIDRPETEEEKELKQEIDHLKKELEKEAAISTNGEPTQEPGGEKISLQEMIAHKERDLELLIRELGDKVRFGQKPIERPGSGAGKFAAFPERPPSQSGRSEDARNMDFMDRPRSRGTGDVWTRPGDDRRNFQGGMERGFLSSRDMDRPRSRERW